MHQPISEPSRSALTDLKRHNEWLVLDALRPSLALTRAELTRATGLSRSTIGNVVRALLERELVTEGHQPEALHALTGRPAHAVALRPSAGSVVGIAINRSRLRVAAANLSGRVLTEHQEPVARDATAAEILIRAATCARLVLAEAALPLERVIGVGLGIPGPVNPDFGGVDPRSSLRRWAGVRASDLLSSELAGVPVLVDNDANFGALGELEHGAARGAGDVLYVNVGPGIGGGIVIRGQLHHGHSGYAGEIGHANVVPDGAPCTCGRRGCLSTLATSGAIINALEVSFGRRLTLQELLTRDAAGDVGTQSTLRVAGAHIGRVCSTLIDAINPELVVLGGDLGSRSASVLAGTREAIAAYAQPVLGGLQVVPGELDDRAEMVGAAARVLRDTALVQAALLRSY